MANEMTVQKTESLSNSEAFTNKVLSVKKITQTTSATSSWVQEWQRVLTLPDTAHS